MDTGQHKVTVCAANTLKLRIASSDKFLSDGQAQMTNHIV